MTAYWDTAPCSVVEGRFIAMIMEAALSVHQVKSPGWIAAWWVTSCLATHREREREIESVINARKTFDVTMHSEKKDLSRNSFIRQVVVLVLTCL
jgi:hypothetical protein